MLIGSARSGGRLALWRACRRITATPPATQFYRPATLRMTRNKICNNVREKREKQVKKCDRKSQLKNMPIRTHFRTHSSRPFPHALPHAHRMCGSAIIRTCAAQPNVCILYIHHYNPRVVYLLPDVNCWWRRTLLLITGCPTQILSGPYLTLIWSQDLQMKDITNRSSCHNKTTILNALFINRKFNRKSWTDWKYGELKIRR